MPLLPFPRDEMLLPGMTQDLHLYEPRYMTMVDRLMTGSAELAHVVVDEAGSESAAASDAFEYGGAAFCYAVVVKVSAKAHFRRFLTLAPAVDTAQLSCAATRPGSTPQLCCDR